MRRFVVMIWPEGHSSPIEIATANDLSIAESYLENFLNSTDEFEQGLIWVGDEFRVYSK